MDLIRRQVRFRVRDVQFPEIRELLLELHGNDVLQGEVIDVTHGGDNGRDFAVVQLAGLERLSLVAVDCLLESP